MGKIDWQMIITGLLVVAAIAYLVRFIYKAVKGENHDCPDCAVGDTTKDKKFKKPVS